MDKWAYNDIPITDWKVTYSADPITGEIELVTRVMDRITREILQAKSDCLRNALIDLGWKPPTEPPVVQPAGVDVLGENYDS